MEDDLYVALEKRRGMVARNKWLVNLIKLAVNDQIGPKPNIVAPLSRASPEKPEEQIPTGFSSYPSPITDFSSEVDENIIIETRKPSAPPQLAKTSAQAKRHVQPIPKGHTRKKGKQ